MYSIMPLSFENYIRVSHRNLIIENIKIILLQRINIKHSNNIVANSIYTTNESTNIYKY